MNYLLFLEELNLYIHGYLWMLPDDKGEDIIDASYQEIAQDELGKFREWVRLRGEGVI